MPEPTAPDPARGVPPHPPSEYRVDEETRQDIGYVEPNAETDAKLAKIRDQEEAKRKGRALRNPDAKAAQQEINKAGAQAAWLNTPDGMTFTNLKAKQEVGIALTSDETATLARIIARRENRHS